jgi:hypothetical protein
LVRTFTRYFLVPQDLSKHVLSNVGYQLSSVEVPLDQLNNAYEPAGKFTPVGISDGTLLEPGQVVVPEPATIVMLLAAAAMSVIVRGRRRRDG